jgi:SAM-dependent methyltransferase
MIPDPTIPTRLTVMGGTLPAGKVGPHMPLGLHSTLFGMTPRHERLVASARGTVLELGGGYNLPHYRNVDRVVVAEPDAATSGLLDRVAASVVDVEIHESALDDTRLAPATFDTVVSTFVLCTTPEPDRLLARVRALLRPSGRLLFLEHARGGGVRGFMQAVASPMWQRVFSGCHPERDPVAAVRAAGFHITDLERFPLRLAAPVVRPAVRGVAHLQDVAA